MTWLHVAGIAAVAAFVIYANRCAYYNGATDGYGYSKEPTNPATRRPGCTCGGSWRIDGQN